MRPTRTELCPICGRKVTTADLAAFVGGRPRPKAGPGQALAKHLAAHLRRGEARPGEVEP